MRALKINEIFYLLVELLLTFISFQIVYLNAYTTHVSYTMLMLTQKLPKKLELSMRIGCGIGA